MANDIVERTDTTNEITLIRLPYSTVQQSPRRGRRTQNEVCFQDPLRDRNPMRQLSHRHCGKAHIRHRCRKEVPDLLCMR